MTTLVDAKVLIDVAGADRCWRRWSGDALATAANLGALAINPLIYAELAAAYESAEALDEALPASDLARLSLPFEAAYLAGQAFVRYRRAGGVRRSPLPDLYIGAHAQVEGLRLLTRDPSRYRAHFPDLELIGPE